MRRVIREHIVDVLAVFALIAAGIFSTSVILINQRAALPEWLPVFGSDRFELKAELSTAQSVTPGQGQSVDIAGIRVGDITDVELDQGHALVTMKINREYAPLINEDASMLLRPKTGLNDMVLEVDPGVSRRDIEEGSTVPLASTLPNVNPDEILAALDADTQAFLRLLLGDGARAVGGARSPKLAGALRQLEPFARDIAKINGLVAKRRENVRRAIHNFAELSEELGNRDADLTAFVDSSNAVLGRFANQEASIREALRELPSTLRATNSALGSADAFALEAAPALRKLTPGSRELGPALEAMRPFFRRTTAPIRDQIRPFTRQVQAPVKHVRQASQGLGRSVPDLKTAFASLNLGLNAIAYNPSGAEEGFLFHIPWLNHNLNSTLLLQDAHGPIQRAQLMETCSASELAEGTVFPTTPFLSTAAQLTGFLQSTEIC